jgi:hypothetical protein
MVYTLGNNPAKLDSWLAGLRYSIQPAKLLAKVESSRQAASRKLEGLIGMIGLMCGQAVGRWGRDRA